jgi:hypothetical protein
MPDEYRVTIRLAPDLYAQLEARGSHGQPLAAIIRDALADYLARQPEPTGRLDVPGTTVAAMAASLAELQAQVQHLTARLDALAADRQPTAARSRQPAAAAAATPADTPAVPAARPPPAADRPGAAPEVVLWSGLHKLTPRQGDELRAKRARGAPIKALMQEYGLSKATVHRYLKTPGA